MIERLAEKIVDWQVKKQYLSHEKRKLYLYAFELLIGQAVNLLIACCIAVLFQAYAAVVVFLLTFIPLRSYAGGHHADSYYVCTAVSNMIICLVCAAYKNVPSEEIYFWNLICGIAGGIMIFLFAPVEDCNKPLNHSEKKRYKYYSRMIWFVETCLWIFFRYLGMVQTSFVIALAHGVTAVLLAAGKLKNHKMKFFE